ncbi:hypothetical protein ACSBR1_004054 [Camellia fascicularis]
MDEHYSAGDLHSKLPQKQRTRFGDSKRVCGFKHRHIHRSLHSSVLLRPFNFPSHAHNRSLPRLPHRHSLPPRIPHSFTAGKDKEEARYFGIINTVAVAVAIIVAVYLLLFDVTGAHNHLISRSFAIILLILLASPISIPLYIVTQNWIRSNSESNLDLEGVVTEPLLGMLEKEKTAMEAAVAMERRAPVIGEDHTIIEALRTVDFWVLFVSFLCGVISCPTSRACNPHCPKRVLLPFFWNVNLTHSFP